MNDLPFKPDYTVRPGETIEEILKERGLSISDLAEGTCETLDYLTDVIAARSPITEELAAKFETFFKGPPARFWLRRQDTYDSDTYRLFWERTRVKPNLFAHLTDDQLEVLQALVQSADYSLLPDLEERSFHQQTAEILAQLGDEFNKRFFPPAEK